jgi:hypothetical protein
MKKNLALRAMKKIIISYLKKFLRTKFNVTQNTYLQSFDVTFPPKNFLAQNF